MARSFLKLYSLDLGFETSHLLTLRTQLVESKYPKPEQRQIFFDALQRAPARAAGRHAGGAWPRRCRSAAPAQFIFEIEGRPVERPRRHGRGCRSSMPAPATSKRSA